MNLLPWYNDNVGAYYNMYTNTCQLIIYKSCHEICLIRWRINYSICMFNIKLYLFTEAKWLLHHHRLHILVAITSCIHFVSNQRRIKVKNKLLCFSWCYKDHGMKQIVFCLTQKNTFIKRHYYSTKWIKTLKYFMLKCQIHISIIFFFRK